MMQYELHCGNSKELLKTLEDNSIDSIVTDPPYELGFMGKKWDASGIAYDVELWKECLRVLKHGGHLLAFSGSRTYHRMTVAIEDAGFEIRDQIMWLYGSGFPKSHDVSKAIDKMAGAEREVLGERNVPDQRGGKISSEATAFNGVQTRQINITAPATDAAKEWNGWGTALKPAHEPICVARKPLIGTVAENVLTHGTGAINVDGCRVAHASEADRASATPQGRVTVNNVGNMPDVENSGRKELERPDTRLGRWPANIIHDGSAEVLAGFPDVKSGVTKEHHNDIREDKKYNKEKTYSGGWGVNNKERGYGDKGSAARFFYCAKASKKDRDEGYEFLDLKRTAKLQGSDNDKQNLDPVSERFRTQPSRNHHPTVKPTNLMQYLCRLVTPKNGLILDPFLGSGSTGKAAMYEGFRFIGFDLNQEYIDIAKARIEYAIKVKNESSGKKENTLFEDEE